MEPEEEWEREGLLDPAWEKQQKKVCWERPKGVLRFLMCKLWYLLLYKMFTGLGSTKYSYVLWTSVSCSLRRLEIILNIWVSNLLVIGRPIYVAFFGT
jgi:hypothetical protein